MKKHLPVVLLAALVCGGGSRAQADILSDNFDDNAIGPQWTLLTDDASKITLSEQNQRLEALATAPTNPTTDALYLSNGAGGFRLSTAADFTMQIDYDFHAVTSNNVVGSALALVFGIGQDLPDGTNSAAVGWGVTNIGVVVSGLTEAHRINDVQTLTPLASPGAALGTFFLSYDTLFDRLTLGDGVNSTALDGLVQGTWGADSVYVSFGMRGNGFSTVSGQAFFDNFRVTSGAVITPEPASLGLVLAGASLLGLRRRR